MKRSVHGWLWLLFLGELILFCGMTLPVSVFGSGVCFFGGAAAMIAAIPIHCEGKKWPWLYFVSIFLNLLGSAMICAIYYVETEQRLMLFPMLTGLVGAVIVLSLVALGFWTMPQRGKLIGVLGGIFGVAVWIFYMIGWIRTGTVFYSFGFFALILALMNLVAWCYAMNRPTGNPLRYASMAGFGIFAVVAFVVLLVLSEGDILDGSELFDGSEGKRKKRKKGKL